MISDIGIKNGRYLPVTVFLWTFQDGTRHPRDDGSSPQETQSLNNLKVPTLPLDPQYELE